MNHLKKTTLVKMLLLAMVMISPYACISVQMPAPAPAPAPGPAPAPSPSPSPGLTYETNTDRPGSDYSNFNLNNPNPSKCRAICANQSSCKACTYVKPGVQGPKARCWLKNAVPPKKYSNCCISGKKYGAAPAPSPSPSPSLTYEPNTDRPGSDYSNFNLNNPNPNKCRAICASQPNCKAYTYVKPGIQGPKARCWLKNAVPPKKFSNCCVSGKK